MKLLPEDPRLTAYALGDIEDEQERIEIEAAVEQSPELQAVVADIQAMGDLLSSGFAEEPAPELSEFEKARMGQPAPVRKRSVGSRILSWPVLTSAAAALIVAFVVLPQRGGVKKDYAYHAEPRNEEPVAAVSSLEVRGLDDAEDEGLVYAARSMGAAEEVFEEMDIIGLDIAEPVVEGAGRKDGGAAETMSYAEFKKEARLNAARSQEFTLGATRGQVVADAPADHFAAPVPAEAKPAAKAKIAASPTATRAQRSMPRRQAVQNSQSMSMPGVSIDQSNLTISGGCGFGGGIGNQQSMADSIALTREQMLVTVDTAWERPAVFSKSIPTPAETWNTEKYAPIEESDFRSPLVVPLSTFSIDVDTASYANVRRFLNQGQLPPADAVRIEELINYFPYSDAAPTESLDAGGAPFAVHMAQTIAPWDQSNHLLRVALKGYEMPWEERPASNLVFLLDVSGSMSSANKLPLVKEAMDLLVRRLDGRDRVAVVVYAGASGLALPSTTANNRETIQHAMENLKAGGSTNGGAGIQLAYKVAREHFIEGGNNRVILCTDGDFNIGQTNQGDLADVAEAAADEGVSLTILGFGMGNYKDDLLEELSNKGKGSYAYVDSSTEARKVFLEDLTSNLFKIAKDVKIQVEFNPTQVKAYRLIGYENRRLKAEDFNNDKKKAGDIGPGHTVVALYEIIPAGVRVELPTVDALRYQQSAESEVVSGEVATVKLRYKQPEGSVSELITRTVDSDDFVGFGAASEDVRFSAIVAALGMRLAGSEHVGELTYDAIESIAASSLGVDPGGHRSEFVGLVRKARDLSKGAEPMPVQRPESDDE
jgi:Ca-activated chloride channel family protein